MQVDVAESEWARTAKPTTLVLEDEDNTLFAIFDGSASWGAGPSGAAVVRLAMRDRWEGQLEHLTAARVEADLRDAARVLPEALYAEEFGCSFSATVAWVSGLRAPGYRRDGRPALQMVCAGLFAVAVVQGAEVRLPYKPRLLIDQLRDENRLPEEAVKDFAHKNVCLGPFVADGSDRPYAALRAPLEPGARVVLAHHVVLQHLVAQPRLLGGTAHSMQSVSPRKHKNAVVVLDVPLAPA